MNKDPNVNLDELSDEEAQTLMQRLTSRVGGALTALKNSEFSSSMLSASRVTVQRRLGLAVVENIHKLVKDKSPLMIQVALASNPNYDAAMRAFEGMALCFLSTYGAHRVPAAYRTKLKYCGDAAAMVTMSAIEELIGVDKAIDAVFGGEVKDAIAQLEEIDKSGVPGA